MDEITSSHAAAPEPPAQPTRRVAEDLVAKVRGARLSRNALASFALTMLFASLLLLAAIRRSDDLALLALPFWIAALVFGWTAHRAIARAEGALRGKGLLVASWAIPIVGMPALLFAPAVFDAQSRATTSRRCEQIVLAFHAYADDHNSRFPPAAIRNKNSKPLLSWRVAILPYIEQEALYQRFRLDEPWDSPHNHALLSQMPETYRVAHRNDEPVTTPFQVVLAPGAPFANQEGPHLPQDFQGGTSTVAVIEARRAVPWTKPADLECSHDGPLPPLGSPRRPWLLWRRTEPREVIVGLADGSSRIFSLAPEDEAKLRQAIYPPPPGGVDW